MLTAEVWPAISALAALGALLVSSVGFLVGLRKIDQNLVKIEEVKHLADGMKTELVAEVRAAALAKGQEEGRLEQEVGIVAQPQPPPRPRGRKT